MTVKRLMSIETLLHWAYGEQRVHLNVEGNVSMSDSEGDGAVGCLAVASDHSHPDAMTLDRLVSELSRSSGPLVRKHGIAGTRPDWKKGARHRMEPLRWQRDGKARWGEVWDVNNEKNAPKFCPILEVDQPAMVARVRKFYVDWFIGLDALREHLKAQHALLSEHGVNDMLPPMRPWLDDDGAPRVLYAVNKDGP